MLEVAEILGKLFIEAQLRAFSIVVLILDRASLCFGARGRIVHARV